MVRRGSIGDSSGNDFSGVGGGSDTDTGSGVTGDTGSDTTFSGGGGDDDVDDDPGGADPADTGGIGGGSDDDYDPNPSDRETGGSDDSDLSDITGGRDYGGRQSQSTGDAPSRNQGGSGGSTSDSDDDTVSTGDGDVVARPESDASRGVSRTTGPSGISLRGPVGAVEETVARNTDAELPDEDGMVDEETSLQGGDIRLRTAGRRQSRSGLQGGDSRLLNDARASERRSRQDIYTSGLTALGAGISRTPSIDVRQGVRNVEAIVSSAAEETEQLETDRSGLVFQAMDVGSQLGQGVADADIDEQTVDDLTTGGLLTPAEEKRVRRAARQFDQDLAGVAEDTEPVMELTNPSAAIASRVTPAPDIETEIDTPAGPIEVDTIEDGETSAERIRESTVTGVGQLGNVFAAGATAETGVEVAENLPDEAEAGDLAGAAATGGAVATEVGSQAITTARRNPEAAIGSLVGSAATGVVAGAGLGRATRLGRDRLRTAGGTEIDAEDLAGEDVVRTYDPDVDVGPAETQRFPPFRDTDVSDRSQAEAIREQSREFTPEDIQERLGGEPTGQAADLKKGLPVEPEGEGGGRGFQAPESDAGAAQQYETVGTSVGPELSPYFLGAERTSSISLRPGLPDTGGRPTAAVMRVDVEDTAAVDVDELNRQLLEAEEAGDTTAVTLSPDEYSPGEAEAVLPPGATLEQVSDTGVLNRVGVGSEYYTRVSGRRVPVRLFRDPDAGDDVDIDDLSGIERSAGDVSASIRRPTQPVDRPTPLPTPASSEVSVPGEDGEDLVDPEMDINRDVSEMVRERDSRRRGERFSSTISPVSPALSGSGGGASEDGTASPTDVSDPVSSTSTAVPRSSGVPSSTTPSGSGPGQPPSEGTPPSPSEMPPTERPPSVPPTSRGSPISPPPSRPPIQPPGEATPVPTSPPPERPPESELGDDDDDERLLMRLDAEEFDRRFAYGVATPEDVLDGENSLLGDG